MTADVPATEPVVVGRIAGAYGVLGWVRVVSFTEPPENLLSYRPWMLDGPGGWQAVTPATSRPHGAGFVVQLRDLSSRDQAQALAGRLIAVPRAALPDLDTNVEYYWRDLIGLEVFDTEGRHIGRVDHLVATGAHDVLAIEPAAAAPAQSGAHQLLVPFLRQFVPVVDLERGRVVVDWQEPA
jgi:16S rRNA processing protein RimM